MRPILFLLKAASIPPGARWITVRPNGPGTEGQPVLIQPAGDGSMRVVGGAGGKLNYLKLTGVRSEAEYAEGARARAKEKRERDRRQRQADQASGAHQTKKQARELVQAALKDKEAHFVQAAAEAFGWDAAELRLPEEKLQDATPAQRQAAEKAHARALLAKAKAAVTEVRKAVLEDADTRQAVGLAAVPLVAPAPDAISVRDLDPLPEARTGLGFASNFKKRAEAAGTDAAAAKQEARAARGGDAAPPAPPTRPDMGASIRDALAGLREKPLPAAVKAAPPEKLLALVKAEKALRLMRTQAAEEVGRINAAQDAVEPRAFVLEVGGSAVDEAVQREWEDDLRTLRTRAFLEEAGKVAGGLKSLGSHVAVGAFNALNSVALAAGGAALLDRSVVDVLGPEAAAQVLAARLAADLSPDEMAEVREAMESFHLRHYMELSDAALREARAQHELAHQIEVDTAGTALDLARGQEMNQRRREAILAAQRTLGTALGEMETNAALVTALARPDRDSVRVSLEDLPLDQAILRLRALGLERGQYHIERAGRSTVATITRDGMARLAAPVSRDDLARIQAARDIIEGHEDEEGWLPEGVARRPDLALRADPGVAPRLAQPFPTRPADVRQAVRDYIGGRAADGDAPADILSGILAAEVMDRAGDREAFMRAVEEVAPIRDEEGKMVRAEAHQPTFEALADDFVQRMHGAERAPLHRQRIAQDAQDADALHRALAAMPEGVAAFKPVGELTDGDQRALREAFSREFARTNPKVAEMHADLATHLATHPPEEVDGLFGRERNPEHAAWARAADEKRAAINAATMDWKRYVETMGSPARAYAAMQDVVKSGVLRRFAEERNRIRPEAPLKIGRRVIAHDLRHLDALDPEARERRLAEHRGLVDRLRNRAGGRYAAGAVSDKLDAARDAEEAAAQAQMGLFGEEEPPPSSTKAEPEKPLELGQRWTLGHVAERQVAAMVPQIGANAKPGIDAEVWQPSMDGPGIVRQRAVKLVAKNRRVMLGLGTGSGKTAIALSSFTHLHGQGQATRGLFVVPSAVQAQFHAEAMSILEPGRYRWDVGLGADREARLAALRNPALHFNVVTHQALRDDVTHLAVQQAREDGEAADEDTIAARLEDMSPLERRDYMRKVLERAGVSHDFMAVDEGHTLLNRQGKENSRMANVLDAIGHGVPTLVNMSADPVKNDVSEMFDMLHKMDPERYGDRDAFMRRYGPDTAAAREGLRREMARHFYTAKVDPGVEARRHVMPVALGEEERGALARVDEMVGRLRTAHREGRVDVEAARGLFPHAFHEGTPDEETARKVAQHAHMLRRTAALDALVGPAKLDAVAKVAEEHRGRPGVVFARRLDHVERIAKRLEAAGHRVVTVTGKDGAGEKGGKMRAFQRGEHDVLVASDAAAVGANLQAGKWLVQADTPETAMVHHQRGARIHRVGQTEDVDLIDLVADHDVERAARQRLAEKYELRAIATSPMEGLDDTGFAGALHRIRTGQQEEEQPLHAPTEADRAQAGQEDEQHSLF